MIRALLIILISQVVVHAADLKIYPAVNFGVFPGATWNERRHAQLKVYIENCSDKKITIPTTHNASFSALKGSNNLELGIGPARAGDYFKGKWIIPPKNVYSPVTLLPGEIACIIDDFYWPIGESGKSKVTVEYFVQPDFAERYNFWTGKVSGTCEVEVSKEIADEPIEITDPLGNEPSGTSRANKADTPPASSSAPESRSVR